MTQARKDALKELLARVEAGGYDTPNFIALVSKPLMQCRAGEAYRGSLDAALALHNAVLPGFLWRLECSNATVYPFNIPDTGLGFYGEADNPARAWLCAILKALIAECDE